MIVLDTTVLVYAVGDHHALRAPCRSVVAEVSSGRIRATTTVEVLQEFVHVRARRRGRDDAVDLARDYALLLRPLLELGEPDLRAGLELFTAHQALGAFDAVLAAATRRSGAAALVSADTAFASVPELHHLDPGQPGFPEALADAVR